jgi:hypothetical protein
MTCNFSGPESLVTVSVGHMDGGLLMYSWVGEGNQSSEVDVGISSVPVPLESSLL